MEPYRTETTADHHSFVTNRPRALPPSSEGITVSQKFNRKEFFIWLFTCYMFTLGSQFFIGMGDACDNVPQKPMMKIEAPFFGYRVGHVFGKFLKSPLFSGETR